jgi:terminase small subunit / prophage DNA-packing protein
MVIAKTKSTASCNAAELADWLGISPRSIRAHALAGLVVRSGRGRYDHKASVRAYCDHMREIAAGRENLAAEGPCLIAESARLKVAQRLRIEQQMAVERGHLLDARILAPAWDKLIRDIRNGMLKVAKKMQKYGAELESLR